MNALAQQSIMPVMAAFQTLDWMPIALNSFWEYFPHFRVLVVDNNPVPGEPGFLPIHEEESDWLQRHPHLIILRQPHSSRTHGRAVDCAMNWCRENDIDCMLHLEPDCLISGTQWYEALCQGLDGGASMSGSHRKMYGPIHPTPSLWRVADCQATFDYCDRAADEQHHRFKELFDRDWLVNAIQESGGDLSFWESTWDTGQKAWFELAKDGRDHLASETGDFHHFWYGATTSFQPILARHPELNTYRNYTYGFPQQKTVATSPVAQSFREMLAGAMTSLDGQRGVLLNVPQHAEPFDYLAALGAKQALEHAGAHVCVLPTGAHDELDDQNWDFMFILDNNELTVSERIDDLRHVSQKYDQVSKVIWLMRSWATTEEVIQQANDLPHVEVWFCEATSFGMAQRQGLRDIRLVPDPTFGCAWVPFECQNGDTKQEINLANADRSLMPGRTLKHHAEEACTYIGIALQHAGHVITDRVNVHLACVLAGITNTLICEPDSTGNSVYKTWTFRHPDSRLEHISVKTE